MQISKEVKTIKIKYDNKELTVDKIQDLVEKWYHSLTDNKIENYIKLSTFLEKLDEGAFIWRYGIVNNLKDEHAEYYCFEGYHSNKRTSNYVLDQSQINSEMKFHGCKVYNPKDISSSY
jgi:hypothetical protein